MARVAVQQRGREHRKAWRGDCRVGALRECVRDAAARPLGFAVSLSDRSNEYCARLVYACGVSERVYSLSQAHNGPETARLSDKLRRGVRPT